VSDDPFTGVAAAYARFRPTYPTQLFAWLAGLAPRRDRAWDCAAGSGQATLGLATQFAQVVATDRSATMLRRMAGHAGIHRVAARAEASGLAARSASLVVVAQALHWLDREAFFAEVRRVLRADGVVAVWTYALAVVDHAPLQRVLRQFHATTVGPFWPPERRFVDAGLAGVELPLTEIEAPRFEMTASWSEAELLGYLGTWSAVQRYRAARGADPVALVAPEIAAAWPSGAARVTTRWPLALRVGRIQGR
jgi:SAM-dependent methyltransferase